MYRLALVKSYSLHHFCISVLYTAEVTTETVLIKLFVSFAVPKTAGIRADFVSKNNSAV